MSALLTKATDPQLYVTVTQNTDGRVSGIEISDTAPDHITVWTSAPASTVWTTPAPTEWDDDTATATKVLDLAVSSDYRYTDGNAWSEGERAEHAFHADNNAHRTFLRTVEAHVIRAGFLNIHTGTVSCQHYGLNLHANERFQAYKVHDGWYLAIDDVHSPDGRYEYPNPIAPHDASPRRVASAILANLVDIGGFELHTAPMPRRARIRYALWRMTPNRSNFKQRTRQRIARHRNRITVRIR